MAEKEEKINERAPIPSVNNTKDIQADDSKDGWFHRLRKGIQTSTAEKRDVPEGLWSKCPECGYISTTSDLKENLYICPKCNFHHRISSEDYFEVIFDDHQFKELFGNLTSKDILGFSDTKPYSKRIKDTEAKTHLKDSMRVAAGKVKTHDLVIACMDFAFVGGSLGSVMGEKIARAIDYCIKNKTPFLLISKSGGARMMESAFSLMQMAKTSGKLSQLSDAQVPYISLLTDPTFGGVTASFAMLGDLNIAEPSALIGFAGPRIIKETIRKDLPKGFQQSEFLLDHGFLDFIVDRKALRDKLEQIIILFQG
ncbi:MAG: acetyl-CoA carboxylase, carboxyltransferase subunit beta [Chitinophagaceae bacterium]